MFRRSRLVLLPLLTLLFLLLGARSAEACSCARPGTVLDAYEWSEVVVVVRAVSVLRAPKKEEQKPGEKPAEKSAGSGEEKKSGKPEEEEKEEQGPRGGYREVISTTMVAEQVFKGDVKPGDEMVFAQGGGADCIYTFDEGDVGHSYLFYLRRFPNSGSSASWVASTCGRNGRVERVRDDLLYLNNLRGARGRTRISGTVEFDLDDHPSLAGLKVRVVGAGKTYEARTDEHGVYEIYDVPAGRYLLIPETPRGWRVSRFYLNYSPSFAGKREEEFNPKGGIPITLAAGRHAGLDLHFEVENAVSGRIFDPAGRPLNGVCLHLVPAKEAPPGYSYEGDCTEKGGAFRIEEIPPGSYVLVVNQEGKVTSSEPFVTFYYPNAARREDATVFHLGPGDIVEDLRVYVPKLEETIIVEGVLLYSDGRPVADERVEFKSDTTGDDDDPDTNVRTDARGRFSLKLLKGLKGHLYGAMDAFEGEYENCPAIERLIEQSGDPGTEVKTAVLELRAEANVYGVELKYPFPSCKKAK